MDVEHLTDVKVGPVEPVAGLREPHAQLAKQEHLLETQEILSAVDPVPIWRAMGRTRPTAS